MSAMESKFARILCPIDFSDNSLRALDQAIELAQRDGAVLYLMNVVFVRAGDVSDVRHYVSISTASAKSQLDRIARQRLGAIPHEIVVEIGNPSELIEKAAEDLDVDLIAMATHGRTGVSRFFLGSVAEEVVRTSKRPVLTFGPETAIAQSNKILCPVDFDANSIAALKFAWRIAHQKRSELVVLHVATLPFEPSNDAAQVPMPKWKQDILARLRTMVEHNLGADAGCELIVEHGDAATSILETATELRPDLIVMATHGRGGLSHLLLGSVAARIVREAGVPVLTVRGNLDTAVSASTPSEHAS
jgi:nucleotide-binding universal stress UspA family protein